MIHDSDHYYQWMRYELEAVLPRMSPFGVLAADDVDFSYGIIDFCASHGIRPLLLLDKRKVFGLLPAPARGRASRSTAPALQR